MVCFACFPFRGPWSPLPRWERSGELTLGRVQRSGFVGCGLWATAAGLLSARLPPLGFVPIVPCSLPGQPGPGAPGGDPGLQLPPVPPRGTGGARHPRGGHSALPALGAFFERKMELHAGLAIQDRKSSCWKAHVIEKPQHTQWELLRLARPGPGPCVCHRAEDMGVGTGVGTRPARARHVRPARPAVLRAPA